MGDDRYTQHPAPVEPPDPRHSSPLWWVGLALTPLALLVGILFIVVQAKGDGLLSSLANKSETILFDRTYLQPGQIALRIHNSSATPTTITSANVNDAIMPFILQPRGPIPPFGSANLYLLYPWVKGESYDITLVTGDNTSFSTSIAEAEVPSPPTQSTIVMLLLIGLAAGFLPILCGMTGYPAIARAGPGAFSFLLALAGGLLAYLGVALAVETLENLSQASGVFQGISLLAVSSALTFLFLCTIAAIQTNLAKTEGRWRSFRTWVRAAGMGLLNLAGGLAAGTAFNTGSPDLGVQFVIALIALNVIQGLRMMADLEHSERTLLRCVGLAAIAGVPAVLGIWYGGQIDSQFRMVLIYAIGVGAVAQALYELIQGIRQHNSQKALPVSSLVGFAAGILALYMASMLIA